MENQNEKTIRYLRDAHAAEAGTENIFAGHANDGNLPNDLRSLAQQALEQTRDQKRQIEQRIQALGGGGESGWKDFVNDLLAKGSDLLNIGHNAEDKFTQDLIKAYAAVSLHVGAYESLRAYTQSIGDTETAQLATQWRRVDEEIGKGLLKAIGRAAPEAADTATNAGNGMTTDGSAYATGVNRDLDYNSGANTSTDATTYSGGTSGGSSSNATEYRDPNTDPALRILDPNVPGGLSNPDPTNHPATPENPTGGTRML